MRNVNLELMKERLESKEEKDKNDQ